MPRNSVQTPDLDNYSFNIFLAPVEPGDTSTVQERLHAQVTVFYDDEQSGQQRAESILFKLDPDGPILDGAQIASEAVRRSDGSPVPSRFNTGQTTALLQNLGRLFDCAVERIDLD